MASTAYGDLNNFDTVNDTGQECHGFEIEIDDIHSTDITYTYDWNHYGTPRITEDNSDSAHPKVFIRYAATYAPGTGFSAFTAVPTGPINPTNGHMCTDPGVNLGCEHFGVGYYGSPTAVRYNWLIEDPMTQGTLIQGPAVNVATPTWTYYPPNGAQVAQVQAAIRPPPEIAIAEFGEATWVKGIKTTTHNNQPIELRDLVSDDHNDPSDPNRANGEPAEVETEWWLLQTEFANVGEGNGELLGEAEDLPNGDEVVTRRWEFYQYAGPYDGETHEALCDKYPQVADPLDLDYKAECDPGDIGDIRGDYIGAQMAGFNVEAVLGLIDHLQDAEVNVPYPDRTVVVGGNTPYVASTSVALPAGLLLNSETGVLSGTATTLGDYAFTVTATDADNVTVSREYILKVLDPTVPNPPQYLLSVAKAGSGSGIVTGNAIDCGSVCAVSLDADTAVSLTAQAEPNQVFTGWSGDCAGLAICDFFITTNASATATFVPATEKFRVTGVKSGAGTVTSNPKGIRCGRGKHCSALFSVGTDVVLTAKPRKKHDFAGWSIATCGLSLQCTVHIIGDQVVNATFN